MRGKQIPKALGLIPEGNNSYWEPDGKYFYARCWDRYWSVFKVKNIKYGNECEYLNTYKTLIDAVKNTRGYL